MADEDSLDQSSIAVDAACATIMAATTTACGLAGLAGGG
jgi:hypothetical protein